LGTAYLTYDKELDVVSQQQQAPLGIELRRGEKRLFTNLICKRRVIQKATSSVIERIGTATTKLKLLTNKRASIPDNYKEHKTGGSPPEKFKKKTVDTNQ